MTLAPAVLRALAVLAAARWAGVVPASDADAVRAWLTRPGRFPDEAAVRSFLAPSAPMPEGDALPPRLRLLGGDGGLTVFVRSLPGVGADVSVRTVPRGPSRFDHASRVIYLAEDADLPALLHEAGHAATGTDAAAVYERTFRDFPGAVRPEDTALFRCEFEADEAFCADLLSAARATRSYWRGIETVINVRSSGRPETITQQQKPLTNPAQSLVVGGCCNGHSVSSNSGRPDSPSSEQQ